MNYAGFQTALRGLTRGPSNSEVIAWLTGGGLMGLAQRMQGERDQNKEDYWKAKEYELRKTVADANIDAESKRIQAILAGQKLDRDKFQADYGTDVVDKAPDAPVPGEANFTGPEAPSYLVPRFGVNRAAGTITTHIPGRFDREDSRAAAETVRRGLETNAQIARLNAEIAQITDPELRDLKMRELKSQIAVQNANAGYLGQRTLYTKALADKAANLSAPGGEPYAQHFGLKGGEYLNYFKQFLTGKLGKQPDTFMDPDGAKAWLDKAGSYEADPTEFLSFMSRYTGRPVPTGYQPPAPEPTTPPADRPSLDSFNQPTP